VTRPMRDAVIVGAVRSPVGRRQGGLSEIHPVELSAQVLRALTERTGFDPAEVEDVMWGCVSQVGEQSWNIARNAVLAAGWPETVPGTTIDRQCGSSQQAVHFAAATVLAGHADLLVVGGVESMSRVPMGSSGTGHDPYGPSIRDRYGVSSFDQGVGAEMVAERWGFSRTRLDEYSLGSHAAAIRAQDSGAFDAEIEPVAGVKRDEGVRRDTSLERLGALKTPFRPDGVVTAGSASQISDGAAALAVTTSEHAATRGLRPLARIHTAVVAADDPVMVLTAPIPATAKALRKAGLDLSDIGVYEVNEAFAPVPLAWLAETGADPARLNPRGGAIALGHPLGASGARIMTTMLHHMRQTGTRFGLQTMCEGAGMANATILELL
jgi:acetyl-CoA acyltransferase